MLHEIIDLKLQDPVPPEGIKLPGATTLKTSTYGAKLQIDTGATDMKSVISTLVSDYHVADITIEDPPMEQIIAAIYSQAAEQEGLEVGDQGSEADSLPLVILSQAKNHST